MSTEMQRLVVQRSQTSGAARAALMALAYYSGIEDDLAYASNETLVAEQGIALRTLQNGLRRCEELGEIQRQPHVEASTGRRRVYFLDPMFRRQDALPGLTGLGAELGARPGADASAGRTARAGARAPSRVGVRKEQVGTGEHPPRPQGGAGTSTSSSSSPSLNPGHALSSEREDRRSKRSRSRRGRSPRSSASAEYCPLSELAAGERARMIEEASAIADGLAKRHGPDSGHVAWWNQRRPGAHMHQLDPPVVAVIPQLVPLIERQFMQPIRAVLGPDATIIGCPVAAEIAGVRL